MVLITSAHQVIATNGVPECEFFGHRIGGSQAKKPAKFSPDIVR